MNPCVQAPIAVVAALARELAPLRRRVTRDVVLVEMGEGAENVARTLQPWIEQAKPRAVISIGFAGALSPSLRAGDLVVVNEVRGMFSAFASPELLLAAREVPLDGMKIHQGVAISTDRVICEAAGKQRLARELDLNEVGCVDMESSAVAKACSEFAVPLLIVRSITDLLDEDLPLDFNRCRAVDGRIRDSRVVREALFHPGSIKGLLELRRRSRLAAGRLALFVERLLPFIHC